MSEWISVEDRLPEYGSYVLVYEPPSGEAELCIDTSWFFGPDPYWQTYITHWRPLPEPPK